ncbi:putative flavoprotein involved in K+ transport [Fusarium austroafricanum]|uniref:Putative flavoprotein involved in K+ transport n=1 Tax=Fusarium austroafricanum TaxID=2364996 RepID=A0A8H4P902_9HYPO|nr:putative flavoprotein involved in K+ transport [Fusarium austroafricanum]
MSHQALASTWSTRVNHTLSILSSVTVHFSRRKRSYISVMSSYDCQICRVNLALARIRTPDEPPSAAWDYQGANYVGFFNEFPDEECEECTIIDRGPVDPPDPSAWPDQDESDDPDWLPDDQSQSEDDPLEYDSEWESEDSESDNLSSRDTDESPMGSHDADEKYSLCDIYTPELPERLPNGTRHTGFGGGFHKRYAYYSVNRQFINTSPLSDISSPNVPPEHIASPSCQKPQGINGCILSVAQMKNCRNARFLLPKPAHWKADASDKLLEGDERNLFYLSGESSGSNMSLARYFRGFHSVYPPRHGLKEIGIPWPHVDEGCYEYEDLLAPLPVHSYCLDVYAKCSLRRFDHVNLNGLWHWREMRSDANLYGLAGHIPPQRLEVRRGREISDIDHFWQHVPGDEWIVANPVEVPWVSQALRSCRSGIDIGDEQRPQSGFLALPTEIIQQSLSSLETSDVDAVARTCRTLYKVTQSVFRASIERDMPWLWELSEGCEYPASRDCLPTWDPLCPLGIAPPTLPVGLESEEDEDARWTRIILDYPEMEHVSNIAKECSRQRRKEAVAPYHTQLKVLLDDWHSFRGSVEAWIQRAKTQSDTGGMNWRRLWLLFNPQASPLPGIRNRARIWDDSWKHFYAEKPPTLPKVMWRPTYLSQSRSQTGKFTVKRASRLKAHETISLRLFRHLGLLKMETKTNAYPPAGDLRKLFDQQPLPVLTPDIVERISFAKVNEFDQSSSVLEAFAAALSAADAQALQECFFAHQAYWKDILAFTYHLRTFYTVPRVVPNLLVSCKDRGPSEWKLEGAVFVPVTPVLQFIDVSLSFKTSSPAATCSGRLVLLPVLNTGNLEWKIWILSTKLESLDLHPEDESLLQAPRLNLDGVKKFDTDVFIIGGGNAAVSLAARLKALGVESIMAERNAHVGDNWALRYDCMRFHVPTSACDKPYMSYPDELRGAHRLTKNDLANHLRCYVTSLNLNIMTSSRVTFAFFDNSMGKWVLMVETPSGKILLQAKHLVQATGIASQKPYIPTISDEQAYKGISIHSSGYKNGQSLANQGVKTVVIVGSANTAFDILEDCHSAGIKTTMVVRSPTYIVPLEYVCNDVSLGAYNHGVERTDRMFLTLPSVVEGQLARNFFRVLASQEPDRYSALKKAGFPVLDSAEPNQALYSNLIERAGGHYVDVGGTDLLAQGKADIKAGVEPTGFTEKGLRFTDGSTADADAVIWCTGFADRDSRDVVAEILGGKENSKHEKMQKIAASLDSTWGVDSEGEIRGMWKRHLRLDKYWVMGGYMQLHRWQSRTLALQIKASLEGILPPAYRETLTEGSVAE